MRLKVSNVCWKKFRRLKYVTETKNLCDFAHILTLPLDKQFENVGFWQVEISVKPNTKYTLSRLNNDLINLGGATYLGMDNVSSGNHRAGTWLNYELLVSYCKQQITVESNADGKLWIFFSSLIYNAYKNGQNPFGYLQLELGSTASPYQPYGYLPLNRGKYIANKEPVQLLDKSKYRGSSTTEGITFTNNGDGTWTVVGTAPDDPINHSYVAYSILLFSKEFTRKYFIPGHKIVVGGGKVNYDAFVQWILGWPGGYLASNSSANYTYTITEYPENFGGNSIELRVNKGKTVNFTFKPQFFDLTAMYGAGNEPTTVKQFRADFPNEMYDYNPYNAITFR